MKRKRLAAFIIVLALVLSLSVPVFAGVDAFSLMDILQLLEKDTVEKYNEYTEQEWCDMTPQERSDAFSFAVRGNNGILNGYGESVITSDGSVVNPSDNYFSDINYEDSFDDYNVLTGKSASSNPAHQLGVRTRLENDSIADFHMGYYNALTYIDGSAADTLNDELLDYMQRNPLSLSNGRTIAFENGYSIELYVVEDPSPTSEVFRYSGRYSIYDNYGTCLYSSSGWLEHFGVNSAHIEAVNEWVSNFRVYQDDSGQYMASSVWTGLSGNQVSDTYAIWNYIPSGGTFEDVSDDPQAIGVDDNGNKIDLTVNSDGVTYEGNTYNYNDDNSVTINGNTYYITVNPNTVDDDYYKQFLQQVINNYYNYYNTDSTPFDGSDILTSLKSIFTSLETFRSYCYSQLKQIYDIVHDGFNSMCSSFRSLGKKLDTIIDLLKDISKNVDELTEEQEKENKESWLELIDAFKKKVGWASLDKSMNNISDAFFGEREYSLAETGEIEVQIVSRDGSHIASSMPSFTITFMGQSYELYSCLGYLGSEIETIKQFISLFLWVGFIISVFRSVPSILGGVASLQDHSNNVTVDKRTGEVKRGA